jgi:hypothetical protein
MRLKCGYSIGFAGTESEWEEDVPDEVVAAGQDAIDEYVEETHQGIFEDACEKISSWVTIIE